MFVTGDETHWAIADYQSLIHLVENEDGDKNPNIDFLISMNGNVEETRGNVLSRIGITEDPLISIKGGHYEGVANGLIVWGDQVDLKDFHNHDYLKTNHGGVNVFVRQFRNPRAESSQQLPIQGITAGPGVALRNASLVYDGIVQPSRWRESPRYDQADAPTTENGYIDVDLGDVYKISEVVIWHYYLHTRQQYSLTVELSKDGVSFQTIYETGAAEAGPVESESGNVINLVIPVEGRYIRHRCGISTHTQGCNFIEIAAFGVQVPKWYPFPQGNGPLYSDAVSFCASRPGDLTRLCSFDEVCPDRLTAELVVSDSQWVVCMKTGTCSEGESKMVDINTLHDVRCCSNSRNAYTPACNDTSLPNILAKYYEGIWNKIPNFDSLVPYKSNYVSNIDFSDGSFGAGRTEDFGVVYEGWLKFPQSGRWQLCITSDDASSLYINGEKIVNNGGLHSSRQRCGAYEVEDYGQIVFVRVDFIQAGGAASLIVKWKLEGVVDKTTIPQEAWMDMSCNNEKTFSQAVAICENDDARLCAKAQLENGCTAGSGCSHNGELVWAASYTSKPFIGNAAQEFEDTQWVPASDYENGWINAGPPDEKGVPSCNTYLDGMGTKPAWGNQSTRYSDTRHILCCVDKRPIIPLKLTSKGNVIQLPEPIPYEKYARAQDKTGTAEIIEEGNAIEFRGNAWKAFQFNYDITEMTAVSFTVSILEMAEVHAFCLAVNLDTNGDRCFTIGGTDTFGVSVRPKTQVWETRKYVVNVGQHLRGGINYFALVQDNDAHETYGYSVFRDIIIYESTRNIALGKPAYQSSQYQTYYASNAVDNDYGTFSHTQPNLPWWKVDLQTSYNIGVVKLYNRQDCCQERLSNLKINLLDVHNDVSPSERTYGDVRNGQIELKFNFNGVEASLVKVSLQGNKSLHLGEVEVFEETPEFKQFVGCYSDSWNHALPHYVGNHIGFDECAESCWVAGYYYFGRQYTGQCYCGGLDYSDISFTKYGASMGCDCDGSNIGSFKNCVYRYTEDPDFENYDYPQVCDNGLVPGDLVVTAFNTDTGNAAKPVVAITTLRDLWVGDEFYMTDRAIDCEGPGPCRFADFADSYMDGTVKFTAPEEIVAGKTIAYTKHIRPYSTRDVYFIPGNSQYSDDWTETWTDPVNDVNQFHLFSKIPQKDTTTDYALIGDNIILYCMAGSRPVFLFSLLYSDEPQIEWTEQGDVWGGDLSEGSTGPVASRNSYAPPYGPALILNPTTVLDHIPPGAVTCTCDNPNRSSPQHTFTCTDGSTDTCDASSQCVLNRPFEKGALDTACGKNLVAKKWRSRNHYRLIRPECGLESEDVLSWVLNSTNWAFYKSMNDNSITGIDVVNAYKFVCDPDPEERTDSQHEAAQQEAIQEAVLEGALNLARFQMDTKMETLRSVEYHAANNAMRERRSKYLPDGKTPIKGNEAPQTQAIDPRVPLCFAKPMCKIAHVKQMEDLAEVTGSGENQMYKKRHPLGQDSAFGTFYAVY